MSTSEAPRRTNVDLPGPSFGVCASPRENGFFLACHNHGLYYLSVGAQSLDLYAGIPHKAGRSDGPRLGSATFTFDNSIGLFATRSGVVLISECENHLIRSVGEDCVITIAGTGVAGLKDGRCAEAQFNKPMSLVYLESRDETLVADYDNHRIRLIRDGIVSTFIGSTAGAVDGSLGVASLRHPSRLYVSPDETSLSLSDASTTSIRRIDLVDRVCTTIHVKAKDVAHSTISQLPDQSCLLLPWHTAQIIHFTPCIDASSSLYGGLMPSNLPPIDALPDEWERAFSALNWNLTHLAVVSSRRPAQCVLIDVTAHIRKLSINGEPEFGAIFDENNAPHFSDLHIVNKHRNTTFFLHKYIADAYSIDHSKLERLLGETKLPSSSLKFFVRSLYSPHSSLVSLSTTLHDARLLLHGIYLYDSVGADPIRLVRAAKLILSRLNDGNDLCTLLLDIWTHCEGDDVVTTVMLPFLHRHRALLASQAPNWTDIIARDPIAYSSLIVRVSTLEGLKSDNKPIAIPLVTMTRQAGAAIVWKSKVSVRKEPVPPGLFVIGITNHDQVIEADMVIIYCAWSYIRHLVTSGLSESQSRIIELPSDFPPTLLYSLIRCLHGLSDFEALTRSDCIYLLAHRGLYDISNSPVLLPLYDHCHRVVFAPLTVENCLDDVLLRHTIGTQTDVQRVLQFIVQNFAAIKRQHTELPQLWAKLPNELLVQFLEILSKQ